MSTQFTTGPIETLDDWNEVLSGGCCCQMPGCPVPGLVCDSKSAHTIWDLWAPYAGPVDESPWAKVPNLYADRAVVSNLYYDGEGRVYYLVGDATVQSESLSITTFVEDVDLDGTLVSSIHGANTWTAPSTCGPSDPAVTVFNETAVEYLLVSEGNVCTETTSRWQRLETSSGGVLETMVLKGCPLAPWGVDGDWMTESWDIDRWTYEGHALSGPVTELSAIASTEILIPALWTPATITGHACGSSVVIKHLLFQAKSGWPTRESLSDLAVWQCDDSHYKIPMWVDVTDNRYRWSIPTTFGGSYFKITWDVLTEPLGWDDTIEDPDYEPPVPNDPPEPIPRIPRPERPLRTLVDDLTWVWAGPGTQIPNPILDEAEEITNQEAIDAATDSWLSDWYDLNPPAEVGSRRIVNIRFECYHGPFGHKPQVTGESVTLPD